MRGIPRHLNTKKDYLKIKAGFSSLQWKPHFQELLDSKDEWLNMGVIAEGKGITDATHKVVENTSQDETIEKYQFEFKENPDARIFRLGFSANEVQGYINGS